eukprot:1715957-Prymnesium_polylepis.1
MEPPPPPLAPPPPPYVDLVRAGLISTRGIKKDSVYSHVRAGLRKRATDLLHSPAAPQGARFSLFAPVLGMLGGIVAVVSLIVSNLARKSRFTDDERNGIRNNWLNSESMSSLLAHVPRSDGSGLQLAAELKEDSLEKHAILSPVLVEVLASKHGVHQAQSQLVQAYTNFEDDEVALMFAKAFLKRPCVAATPTLCPCVRSSHTLGATNHACVCAVRSAATLVDGISIAVTARRYSLALMAADHLLSDVVEELAGRLQLI